MKKIKQPQTGEGEKPRGASECQEHSLPPAAREASGTGMCMSTELNVFHPSHSNYGISSRFIKYVISIVPINIVPADRYNPKL